METEFNKPNHCVTFSNAEGVVIATLDFNTDKLIFTGDADAAAQIFIDAIEKYWGERHENPEIMGGGDE